MNTTKPLHRILIADDNPGIHEDFKKVLCPPSASGVLDSLESELFGVEPAQLNEPAFEVNCTFQGEEALARVAKSLAEGRPYSLAFIDMRMPPGWDGMRTIEEILDFDPELPLVTCTAFSDYTPEQVVERIGLTEGYLFIRKPFEPSDIRRIVDRMARVRAA